MAGQVNSWMEQINISPIPCIGDTVRKTSSTDNYSNMNDLTFDGNGYLATEESEAPLQFASLWWLIALGLGVGLLLKGRRRNAA